jgi:hypothetical protein
MHLTTLEMTPEEATRRLAEYSEQLAAERSRTRRSSPGTGLRRAACPSSC